MDGPGSAVDPAKRIEAMSNGRFSFQVLREICQTTTKITAMMMFILVCAKVFALAFRGFH